MANREELILGNLSLAHIIASQIYRRIDGAVDYEDLEQYAILGLIDAVDRRNPDASAKFTTYAGHRIRGYVLDELRRLDICSRPMRKAIKNGLKEDIRLISYHGCVQLKAPESENEDLLDLKTAIKELTQEERRVICYKYYLGLSLNQISKKFNQNYKKTMKIHNNAINKLRRILYG